MGSTTRPPRLVVLLMVLSVLGGGCSSDGSPAMTQDLEVVAAAGPAVESEGPVIPPAAAVVVEPPVGPHDLHATFEPALPPPVWTPQARTAARETARVVMVAFARPGLDPDGWWAGVAPYLTIGAQQVYVGVDPANVPPTTITGQARIVDDTSVYLATVAVATDVGDYQVLLSRQAAGDLWLVERLDPPHGVGP